MTPAARFAAAIDILDQWRDGTPAEQALTRWARGARYAGSKDRAAVRDHVYDVLRRKGRCAALGGGETGRALVLGLTRSHNLAPDDIFTGQGHAPSPLSDAERINHTPADANADVPSWCLPLLTDRDPNPALIDALAERAQVWLRSATRKGSRDAAQVLLEQEGISTSQHPTCATALQITEGARRLRQSEAYSKGLVELQDLSAQLAVARQDWPETGRILDYCAGGGGKALAIADRTSAQIVAYDAMPRRMADLPARAQRAGVHIETLSDPSEYGPYEAVLIDVPCSGSGTWRRDPDTKWRLGQDRLKQLTETQDDILEMSSALVSVTGVLVYMTCSLFRSENEDRIAAFLGRNPHWKCTDMHCDTPLTASDGFFSARLERR